MLIDVLVAEIGSTTTIVNAFDINSDIPRFLGRGVANTTVDTDVNIGLELAVLNLAKSLNVENVDYKEMFASSSAAGGLRMTVHGLVYEMTVRASKEAALNAGANIHLITANKISEENLQKIIEIKPELHKCCSILWMCLRRFNWSCYFVTVPHLKAGILTWGAAIRLHSTIGRRRIY